MMRAKAEPRRYTGFAEASGFDSERMRPLTESGVSAVVSSADAPDGLDWQTFTAARFPGRRRHDLDAIAAYGAYRGSDALDRRPIQAGTRTEDEQWRERIDGLEDWEDEGGAMP